jgi:hypothetical protein
MRLHSRRSSQVVLVYNSFFLRRSLGDVEREHRCEENSGDVYAKLAKKEKAVFGQ